MICKEIGKDSEHESNLVVIKGRNISDIGGTTIIDKKEIRRYLQPEPSKGVPNVLEEDVASYIKKGPQVLDIYTQRTVCNLMLYFEQQNCENQNDGELKVLRGGID